jgi:hypothetical protein
MPPGLEHLLFRAIVDDDLSAFRELVPSKISFTDSLIYAHVILNLKRYKIGYYLIEGIEHVTVPKCLQLAIATKHRRIIDSILSSGNDTTYMLARAPMWLLQYQLTKGFPYDEPRPVFSEARYWFQVTIGEDIIPDDIDDKKHHLWDERMFFLLSPSFSDGNNYHPRGGFYRLLLLSNIISFQAIFTRAELDSLISSRRIDPETLELYLRHSRISNERILDEIRRLLNNDDLLVEYVKVLVKYIDPETISPELLGLSAYRGEEMARLFCDRCVAST